MITGTNVSIVHLDALTPSPTHTAVTRANSLGQLYTGIHVAVRRAEPSMSFF
jgi:hypothetical protein